MRSDRPETSLPVMWLRRIFSTLRSGVSEAKAPPEPAAQFRAFYERFREILALNDTTLGLIADIEEAFSGRDSVDEDVIIQRIRHAARDVYMMVKNLNAIADGRYGELYDVLRCINANIEGELPGSHACIHGPWIIPIQDIRVADARLAGTKMANLGEMRAENLGVHIPDGFVITSAAFAHFMGENALWTAVDHLEALSRQGDSAALAHACNQVGAHILDASVSDELRRAMFEGFDSAFGDPDTQTSVRSSATGEDRVFSHAGQYHSELYVSRSGLVQAYKRVVASAFHPRAVTYRLEQGLRVRDATMAVGCTRMVDARCSGVMFSRDFTDPASDRIVISATPGISAGVVSGQQAADEIVVSGGAPRDPALPYLSLGDLESLVKVARLLELLFKKPQDIEWAIDTKGVVCLLQSRPMRILGHLRSGPPVVPDGVIALVDGGYAACPGAASGPVFMVEDESELDQIPQGAVIVTHHSSPGLSRAMRRAAAVITDIGSPTGHMAILAREFATPCIVNTHCATKVLQHGKQVTVDAFQCRVFPGVLPIPQHLLEPEVTQPASLEIMNSLRLVARYVIPLNLTDPASEDFRPMACQSLHDITRFVHEKVFGVMFHFGDIALRDKPDAVKLIARLPFEILVYDVGMGIAEAAIVNGSIDLDGVTSFPMHAFLEGLLDSRIRWHEPRPLSTRGFLSVLGESMTSPPPDVQQIGRTSYGVVSDRYMNFSTKAGYHFSTVDTYAGSSLNKNYIHFRFSGGATSVERRARRIEFLHEVLTRLDFRTRPRGDMLVARLEKYDAAAIGRRLTILGRLTMVARQLDMLMDTPDSPRFFASAFLDDRMECF